MTLLLTLALLVSQATYYVAKTGDDGNPGTEAEPWLTIAQACSTLDAGDTAWVKQGTYVEALDDASTFKNAGTASNRIVLRSYNGWNTVLNGYIIATEKFWSFESLKFLYDFSGDEPQQAIKLDGDSCSVLYCDVEGSPSQSHDSTCGILIGSIAPNGQTISGNWVHGWGGGHHGHGIYTYQARHGVFTYNTINDNNDRGMCIYPRVESCEVAYNLVYENGLEGIYVNSDSGGGNVVHHNIVRDNPYGLSVDAINLTNQVYSNTITGSMYYGLAIHDSNHVCGNIIAHNGRVLDISGSGAVLDHNCYWPDGSTSFRWDDWEHMANFAGYRETLSQDSNSLAADPLFVDTAAHNYRLKPRSPCIDAGDPATTPGLDFEGKPYPQGRGVDIGAFENNCYTMPVSWRRLAFMD